MIRRIYPGQRPGDGARVLAGRYGSAGAPKNAARLTEWAKDIAPSAGLRTRDRPDPAKSGEFRRR